MLNMNTKGSEKYKNPTQKIRCISENWMKDYMYCPACLNNRISKTKNNTQTCDFLCNECKEKFELKSSQKPFKNKITVFAKAGNLLNTPMEVFVKGKNNDNDEVPDQQGGATTLIRRDYYQRTYMIGFRYKI